MMRVQREYHRWHTYKLIRPVCCFWPVFLSSMPQYLCPLNIKTAKQRCQFMLLSSYIASPAWIHRNVEWNGLWKKSPHVNWTWVNTSITIALDILYVYLKDRTANSRAIYHISDDITYVQCVCTVHTSHSHIVHSEEDNSNHIHLMIWWLCKYFSTIASN